MAFILVSALMLLVARPAVATDLAWKRQVFDLQASNEPLNVFLIRIFTLQGIPVVTSPTVATARVSGHFKGRADIVFQEVVDTYGLTWYYDGTTLYIYGLAEIESRILQVEPADVGRIERAMRQMHLADARFPLRISPEEGQVFVAGPPRYVDILADVIGRVTDSPSHPRQQADFRVFRLRYAQASDRTVSIGGVDTVVPGVASIVGQLAQQEPAPDAPAARSSPRTVPGLRGQGLAAVGGRATPASGASGGLGAGATLSATPPVATDLSESSAGAAAVRPLAATPVRSEAVVRADPRLNAVIVRDLAERMPIYERLIAALDIDSPLLEIEASVIDIDTDKSEQLGIDWRAHGSHADVVSSPGGLAGNGSAQTLNLASNLLAAGNPVSAGTGLVSTLLFGSERDYFLARVNALATHGDANLLSRPRVLTFDNQEAVLQNTSEFFVPIAGREQTDLYNVSTGLLMRVTPTMVEDAKGQRVRMQIHIEDGTASGTGTVGAIPIVARNAISTQAVVGSGQSLLIGGYVIEEKHADRSGVPWLSDIPLLGLLFGQKSNTLHRVERLFLITPRVVGPSTGDPPVASAKATSRPLALDLSGVEAK